MCFECLGVFNVHRRCLQNYFSKLSWTKNFSNPKLFSTQNSSDSKFGPRYFGLKISSDPKFSELQTFRTPNFFCTQICFGPHLFFRTFIFFRPSIFVGPKLFYDLKLFRTILTISFLMQHKPKYTCQWNLILALVVGPTCRKCTLTIFHF